MILYVGVNFIPSLWLIVLYVFLNVIAYNKMYLRKVNDRDYMGGELEQNLEYRELIEQKNLKRQELNELTNEEEMLNELVTDLYLEIEYLHMFISEIVDEEEIQMGIDEALRNGIELEIEYVESKGVVKRRVKKDSD